MSFLAESLERLYKQKEVSLEKIKELLSNKLITESEYKNIIKNG